jgi:hypothetical protein
MVGNERQFLPFVLGGSGYLYGSCGKHHIEPILPLLCMPTGANSSPQTQQWSPVVFASMSFGDLQAHITKTTHAGLPASSPQPKFCLLRMKAHKTNAGKAPEKKGCLLCN